MSALDWSAGLFLVHGFLWIAIGVLTPPLIRRDIARRTLIFSNASDTKAFGVEPAELLGDERVRKLWTTLLDIVAGLLAVGGILVVAVAWFGLRAGERWALVTLTIVPPASLVYWMIAARPFQRAGVRLRLVDVPPFMWVPTAVAMPAIVLGWMST